MLVDKVVVFDVKPFVSRLLGVYFFYFYFHLIHYIIIYQEHATDVQIPKNI